MTGRVSTTSFVHGDSDFLQIDVEFGKDILDHTLKNMFSWYFSKNVLVLYLCIAWLETEVW